MGKEVSKTLKWMDGGRNREAVLRDPRQERRDLEHTEMEWLGRLSDGGRGAFGVQHGTSSVVR